MIPFEKRLKFLYFHLVNKDLTKWSQVYAFWIQVPFEIVSAPPTPYLHAPVLPYQLLGINLVYMVY